MASLHELMDLRGRKALVTGGAGHIGPVAVEALKELGADVAITDHQWDRLQDMGKHVRALTLLCDLSEPDEVEGLIESVEHQLGGLDILVHCAALTGQGGGLRAGWVAPLAKQSAEAFEYSFRVQALSLFKMCQRGSRMLGASGRGSVIVLGSIYGIVAPDKALYAGTGMAAPLGYSATKGAVLQMVRHLAAEMAPAVRVNCLTPGGLLRSQAREFVDRYTERTPLGRMGKEEDLKGAIAFLASDLSSYMTGANLVVDGGWSIW